MVTLAFLSSCDYKQLWEEKHYEVHWLDGNISLVRKLNEQGNSIARVAPEVIAVGSNVSYIVAKRRWNNDATISYYFLDKLKDSNYLNPNEITQGPFTETEFKVLKQKFGLPEFTKTF